MKATTLPEKDFYTLKEVAERYNCSPDLIEHYILEKQILRTAVLSKEVYFDCCGCYEIDLKTLPAVNFSADRLIYAESNTYTDEPRPLLTRTICSVIKNYDEDKLITVLPRFLYLHPDHMRNLDSVLHETCMFLDFEGNGYILVNMALPGEHDTFAHFTNFFPNFGLVVPLEELRRFEAEHLNKNINRAEQVNEGQKSRNAMLKTIMALSEFASEGLTGKPYTDASVVLAALKSRGVSAPVGERKLAEYLKEAHGK